MKVPSLPRLLAAPTLSCWVVIGALGCKDTDESESGTGIHEPSPNASILPSPLASTRPLPLSDAGPTTAVGDAGDADASDASAPPSPPSYFALDRPLLPESLPVTEAPGVRLEAQFMWQPRSAGGRGDSKGRFPLRIDLSSIGRMRIIIESDQMPLGEDAELRARFDHYGHVLVWPNKTDYRVVGPGTLRALFEELRADVAPLEEAQIQRQQGGKVLGLPVHEDTVQTAMGTLVMEQAQVGGLGNSGALLCRFLSELVLAKPDNSACRDDWVPLKAEYGWVDEGRFGFLVTSMVRKPDLKTRGFLTPPAKSSYRRRQLPERPPLPWISEDRLAHIEPGAKHRPPPSAPQLRTAERGLVITNRFETPRYVLINGDIAAWLGPGATVHFKGLRPGGYALLARDFLGIEPEEPLALNAPGRQTIGLPTDAAEGD